MFESLGNRLGGIFDRLTRRGHLSEADVDAAMREVRVALLEADVALSVVKDFTARIRERATGQEVTRSVTPGQQVIKIVHDNLVELLGTTAEPLNNHVVPPAVIMMLGLQGSGKTTTSAKLALRLTQVDNRKVLLASLDVHRPAAQEQLAVLAQQVGVDCLAIVAGHNPLAITHRALDEARRGGYDDLILDTAGRLSIDDELMAEAAAVRDIAAPHELLLVADAMTGQDAVNTATHFDNKVGITGIILTRIDGDQRGGAALSMRAITGKPIKFLGTGEKIDALELYHPDRLAGRILGMGDVVSLVEKAAASINEQEAREMADKFASGERFDLNDLLSQFRQMKKMGGLGAMMGMLPGMGKIKDQLQNPAVAGMMKKQEAIILSMTPAERHNADLLMASRKRRVAKGAGVEVSDVNRLLKQFTEMQKVMKQVRKMGKGKMLRNMMAQHGGM